MDGKTIYIVFDNCETVYNEIIGIFDDRESAEDYAIKMSREWFDGGKVPPEERIVSTDGNGNIYEIYDNKRKL